jgi:AcrR family transcriptional regulator
MTSSPAGTVPQPNGGSRAERILQEAARLFGESGYSGTRMTDIAAAIGVTKPIIYRHFESKQVLFDHWVGESLGERARMASSWILAHRDNPRQLLDGIAAVAVDLSKAREIASIWRIAIGEADRFPQLAETVHAVAVGPIMAALAEALGHAQSAGTVKPGVEPQALADLVIAPLVGHAMLISSFASRAEGFAATTCFASAHVKTIAAAWLT